MSDETVGAKVAALIARDVAEFSDRTSPDDEPDLMLVTSEELMRHATARIDAAVAEERTQAALEEAAKHADCCVDREERDTLRAQVDQTDREYRRVLGLLESALIREEGVRGDHAVPHHAERAICSSRGSTN